jgi:hypothetical protein
MGTATVDDARLREQLRQLLCKAKHRWWWPFPSKHVIDRCVVVCRMTATPGGLHTYI